MPAVPYEQRRRGNHRAAGSGAGAGCAADCGGMAGAARAGWRVGARADERPGLGDVGWGAGVKAYYEEAGITIYHREEKYCEVAANRLRQGVLWGAQ